MSSPGNSPNSSPEIQVTKEASPASPVSRTPSPSPPASPASPASPTRPASPSPASPDISPLKAFSPQLSPIPIVESLSDSTDSTLADLDISPEMVTTKKSPEDKPKRVFSLADLLSPTEFPPLTSCPTSSSSSSSSTCSSGSSDYIERILHPDKKSKKKLTPLKHQTPDLHVSRLGHHSWDSSSSCYTGSDDEKKPHCPAHSPQVQPNPTCSCVMNNTIRVTVQGKPNGSDGCCATCPYRGLPMPQRLNIQAEIQRPAKTDASTQTEGHSSDEVRELLDSRLARHIPSIGGILSRKTEDRLLVGIAIGCAAAILMKILLR